MSVANTSGPLTATGFRREAVETTERGVWYAPPSAFDDEDGRRGNRIASLRRMSGMRLEAVAEQIGMPVEDLAL